MERNTENKKKETDVNERKFFFNVFVLSLVNKFCLGFTENVALGLQHPRKLARYFDCEQYFPVEPLSTGYYCI